MYEAIVEIIKPHNEILALVGVVLALLGISAGIHYSKRGRRPRFGVFALTILSGAKSALKGLEVNFNGHPQDRITVARVIFWNEGKEAIRHGDLSSANPLRIELAAAVFIKDARVAIYPTQGCSQIMRNRIAERF